MGLEFDSNYKLKMHSEVIPACAEASEDRLFLSLPFRTHPCPLSASKEGDA